MRRLLPLLCSVLIAAPAAAQLHPEDSVAVIQAVDRYHAALEAGDTVALRGMLAPGAVALGRGAVKVLRERESLESEGRWQRAVNRVQLSRTARTLGIGAYVNTLNKIEARANPALIQGTEAETVVLSRLGTVWFIETVHNSVGSN